MKENINNIHKLNFSLDNLEKDKPVKKDDIPSKDPFKMEVYVKQTITPDCIYVAPKEYEEFNLTLVSAIQAFYNTYYSEPRDDWSENTFCVAYSSKDKCYFRAKILKIKSPTEVLVFFLEMGIEEIVMMKDLQNLPPQFIKQPTYCFKVKLAGILPCGGSSVWPSLSCRTLSDIIQENMFCSFYITKQVREFAY